MNDIVLYEDEGKFYIIEDYINDLGEWIYQRNEIIERVYKKLLKHES